MVRGGLAHVNHFRVILRPAQDAVVGETVVEYLRPMREKSEELLKNKDYLVQVYREGAEKAAYKANKTLRKVYKKVGFVER